MITPMAVEDSVERGRGARAAVPRSRLAEFDAGRRTRSALQVLLDQEAERDARLLPIRYGRMSSSPWAYLRGAAAIMAADLALEPNSGLTVQLCGDAHVLNFGLWASPERSLIFDLRDFDESLPGPFEWDLKRLAASVIVCGVTNGVPDDVSVDAARSAVAAYREWMRHYAAMSELDIWYDRIDAGFMLSTLSEPRERTQAAKKVRKKALKATSAGAFDKLTEMRDGRRVITEDPPFRIHPVAPDGSDEADVARQVFTAYGGSVPEELRTLLHRFTLTDVVQQVVGVGSVGMRVFLVLLEGRSGEAPLFLQVKQAGASVYEPFTEPSLHANHGQRVVSGQKLMQSATDLFVGWTRAEGIDFYVRQYRDMKVIPDGAAIAPQLGNFAALCGHALAKSHARSGDPVAINAYIGSGRTFDAALIRYARTYAIQTAADHAALADAVKSGQVETQPGW